MNYMKSYNKKCLGCGAYLTNDENQIGYVSKDIATENVKYCQRCFKLINYNQLDNSKLDLKQIEKEINQIDYSRSLYIFHIVDILDLLDTILPDFIEYQAKLVFIVNKMDCLPTSYNAQLTANMIYKTIESFGYNNPRVIFCSSFNKSSIKKINKFINQLHLRNNKIIFSGCSNVGKSTIINQLAKLNNQTPELATSPFINTTIQLKKIKIDKYEIIDTPGLNLTQSILNYLSSKDIKKVTNFKNNYSINFYISTNQTLLIEGLVRIDYLEGEKSTFTFYLSKEVKINRMKTENASKNMNTILSNSNPKIIKFNVDNPEFVSYEFELDSKSKHNLSICGLGLITLSSGMRKIKVTTYKSVGVKISNYAII